MVASRPEPAFLDSLGDEFPNICLNNGRLPRIDQCYLCGYGIYTYKLMSRVGKAPCRNRSYITHSEDTDFQGMLLCIQLLCSSEQKNVAQQLGRLPRLHLPDAGLGPTVILGRRTESVASLRFSN